MTVDLWVICSKCGTSHAAEDYVLQDPEKTRAFPIQTLPKGAEDNNLDTVWVPRCRECGNETFYVQLDPDDMVEVWQEADQREFVLPGTPDWKEGLRIWRERAQQQEAEFQQWRARRSGK